MMRGDNANGHAALRLQRENGLSLKEIGEALGLSRSGVWNAMKRAGAEPRPYRMAETRTEMAGRLEDIDRRRVDRDPCVRCAVPADRHAQHGCRSYRRP